MTDFTIKQGETFNPVLRYMQPHLVVKAITGITKSGQAVVTCTHGLTIDWPVWVVGVAGMTEINHESADLKKLAKAYQGYYVAAGSMRLNVDSSGYTTYTSGGELLYRPPVNLTGYSATMTFKDEIGGTTLVTLTSTGGGITLGAADGTIRPVIAASVTNAGTWYSAVFDLDLDDGTGVVATVLSGTLTIDPE